MFDFLYFFFFNRFIMRMFCLKCIEKLVIIIKYGIEKRVREEEKE